MLSVQSKKLFMSNKKPLFFYAFADNGLNEQEQELNALKEERYAIETVFKPLIDAGKLNVHIEPEATRKHIIKVFNENTYNIVGFHYGGHANEHFLQLMDGKAHEEGLELVLKQLSNLEFVFLNGCLTQATAQRLYNAGITTVIGTSAPISDGIAANISQQFYQSLVSGKTIDEAFAFAKANIQLQHDNKISTNQPNDNLRLISWEGQSLATGEHKQFSWQLYSTNKTWNFERANIMANPKPDFKVFMAYSDNEKDVYFAKQLNKHLSLLKRFKQIHTVSSAQVVAGDSTDHQIKQQLHNANIILLLISADFLYSSVCNEIEEVAMERYRRNLTRVIPILTRPVDGVRTEDDGFGMTAPTMFPIPEFAKLRGLPDLYKKRFITQWDNEDEALTYISRGISQVVNQMAGRT